QDAIETIARRAEQIGLNGVADGDYCRGQLKQKVDFWQHEAQNRSGGRVLTYTPFATTEDVNKGEMVQLLSQPSVEKWETFTCLNSLRDVEPTVKFIVDDSGLDDLDGAYGGSEDGQAAGGDGNRQGADMAAGDAS
ncbi:MAG: hypothetical protein ACKO3T_12605, partial [Planctomycetaceae bacterium]